MSDLLQEEGGMLIIHPAGKVSLIQTFFSVDITGNFSLSEESLEEKVWMSSNNKASKKIYE